MTPAQKRIAIAEACGWKNTPTGWWNHTGINPVFSKEPPDYLNDLNAMHEAEKMLTYFPDYLFHLRAIVGPFPDAMSEWSDYHWQDVVHATAAQRADAFIATLNLKSE